MFLLNLLALTAALAEEPRPPGPIHLGEDIADLRTLAAQGLTTGDDLEAWATFLATHPRSPLAEVVLGWCLQRSADMEALLAPMAPADRAQLVHSYRENRSRLAANPVEGAALSEAE